MESIDDLIKAVKKISPQLSDSWEATAIIESLGYTDSVVAEEFGFENAHKLGEYVFSSSTADPDVEGVTEQAIVEKLLKEVWSFIEQFSSTFVYALSWAVIFVIETVQPKSLSNLIPASLAAPLSLALMFSLITSGGFIQIIARRGLFYMNLKQPMLAKRISLQFLKLGISTTIVFAFIATAIGLYFHLFEDGYLLAASAYYLLLSLLWMLCAIVSIQEARFRIPIIFLSGGLVFSVLKIFLVVDTVFSQAAATLVTFLLALVFALFGFKGEAIADEIDLPRLSDLLHLLLPYFFYGIVYFSFLFADRITAGAAIPTASGLVFGINSDYKKGMDLALLDFLVVASVIEYLNYKYINFWRQMAKQINSRELGLFSLSLKKRYIASLCSILLLYSAFWLVLKQCIVLSPLMMKSAILGGVGYMLFSIAILNAMILFSLSHPATILKSLAFGLAANLFVGYTLSHIVSTEYAAIGLIVGAALFAVRSTQSVVKAIAQPDYAYFTA